MVNKTSVSGEAVVILCVDKNLPAVAFLDELWAKNLTPLGFKREIDGGGSHLGSKSPVPGSRAGILLDGSSICLRR